MTDSFLLIVYGLLVLALVYAGEERRRYRDKMYRLILRKAYMLGALMLMYGKFAPALHKTEALKLDTLSHSVRSATSLDAIHAMVGEAKKKGVL